MRDRRCVHKAEIEPPLHQELRRQANHAPVDRFRDDRVVAGAQETEHRIDGRHSRREDERRVTAFKFCDSPFEGPPVGMRRSRVVVAFVLPELFLNVGRSLIDWRDD